MASNGKLVRNGWALVREPPPYRLGYCHRDLSSGTGVDRLRTLAAIAIDRERFHTQLPAHNVRLFNILDRGVWGHVDGFGDGPREEGLHGGHHADVPCIMDRPRPTSRPEGTIEHRQMILLQEWGALDSLMLVNVLDDFLDLVWRISELFERQRDSSIDQLHHATTHQLLIFDQGDVWLHACRVTVHHKTDRSRWRQERRLRVTVPVLHAERQRIVPGVNGGLHDLAGDKPLLNALQTVPMLANHPQHRFAIDRIASERPDAFGDLGAREVCLAGHQGSDGGGIGAPGIGV